MNKWSTEFLFRNPYSRLLALAKIVFHGLTNGQYGFHRDEPVTLDDTHYLASNR